MRPLDMASWRADVTVWCFSCRSLSDGVKDQLLVTIQKTFNYSCSQAQQILLMVTECMKKRALVGPRGHMVLSSSFIHQLLCVIIIRLIIIK